MRERQQAHAETDLKRPERGAADLERRFPVALLLYAALAVLVWFTMDKGNVLVMGRPVEIRLIPLIVIGGLALRTLLARSAEKIRRDGEKGS
jgi:hypothetical protein